MAEYVCVCVDVMRSVNISQLNDQALQNIYNKYSGSATFLRAFACLARLHFD